MSKKYGVAPFCWDVGIEHPDLFSPDCSSFGAGWSVSRCRTSACPLLVLIVTGVRCLSSAVCRSCAEARRRRESHGNSYNRSSIQHRVSTGNP
jgi:hypothetical protein